MYAESSLANRLKILGVQNAGNFNLVATNNGLRKPARWRRNKSMTLQFANGQTQPVFLRDLSYCLNYTSGGAADAPKYYADLDFNTWFFSPTPDQSYTMFATWYERVQPLDQENPQNWWTDNAPTALLYECLMQLMPFLKNDSRIQIIKGIADEEMASLKTENTILVADKQAIIPDD